MIKVAIIGANGYTGLELMKILSRHSGAEVVCAVSRKEEGNLVTSVFPELTAYTGMKFSAADADAVAKVCDVAFTCLPHAASSEFVARLAAGGCRVVDLSADFRYDSLSLYEATYKVTHAAPELLKNAVYGLCELNRDKVKSAKIVGNPGCYTTCAILSLAPLLSEGLISADGIIVDAKSGVSGAGRKAELAFSFCETADNFKAYGVTTHRHTSEIEEKLSLAAGKPVALSFTPHLLPVPRGILETIYCTPAAGMTPEKIAAAYNKFYGNEPFITVFPEGTYPELKYVTNSNRFMLGYKYDARLNKLILIGALDNLVKGASGQAVQNMNIMFGLDETEGLI